MPLAIALLLLLALIPLVVSLMRANELFFLRITNGAVRVRRGRLPQQLLEDIGDVIKDPPVPSGSLRGVSEDGRVRLYPDADLTEEQKQRLRNVIGQWPIAKVRNALKR
jgi:hypothetical protein